MPIQASRKSVSGSRRLRHARLATDDIQSARNGRSVSNELPFTTNVGTAMNSSVAHNGRGEKRRASDHMAPAAISDHTMYAAWNGISFTSPKTAISAASVQAFSG